MKLNKSTFVKYLKTNLYFEKKPSLAVAVSGGPDSMALLFLIIEMNKALKGKITALIVDHNLRNESKKEAKAVYNFLKNLKINSKILSVRNNQIKKRSMNEARINRYKLLTNYCKKQNILYLFLGHHNDDILETFLLRKIAGSDFEGLQSIKFFSMRNKTCIIRPLIRFTKDDILNYNINHKIPFISDTSNTNLNFTRPAIRKFISETEIETKREIINEFETIKKNSNLYNLMIAQLINKNIKFIKKNSIEVDYKRFVSLDFLISNKIINKFYQFFYDKDVSIRSAKIQILLNHAKNANFKKFYLKGMSIKKTRDSLIFLKITN